MQRSATVLPVMTELCKVLNYPRVLKSESDVLDLLREDFNPAFYSSASDCAIEYGVRTFLKKFKGFDVYTPKELEENTFDAWTASEARCRITNEYIRKAETSGFPPDVASIIHRAQYKIAKLLGVFSYEKVTAECEWTSGATVSLPKGTSFDTKMSTTLTVSSRALPFMRATLETDPMWLEALQGQMEPGSCEVSTIRFVLCDYARLDFVSKDWKILRPIAIEPTGNMFLQKGVGNFFRKVLRKVGVDLNNQEVNRDLCRIAQWFGLATLDLKAASDSVAKLLVRLLLPMYWYNYLDLIRTTCVRKGDEIIPLEKFSSMGNGFTFELESMIFWALSDSIMDAEGCTNKRWLGVYGDDIIVPQEIAPRVVSTLELLGFEVNKEKSFFSGRFFESCGVHVFDGIDITPVYQKEVIDSDPERIRCFNRLFRWTQRIGLTLDPDSFLLKEFPNRRWKIPLSCKADGGYLSTRCREWKKSYGYHCRVLLFHPYVTFGQDAFCYAYKLRRPSYTSPDPRGQCLVPCVKHEGKTKVIGRWIETKVWIC